ncbi:plasma membrane-associated cation-binding protein 1 [Telopea speciosissima]|uniref:plasma membrane-associated cation-binding protein 1 n=1 Tax=Telopea speciosissima TaxID=54955 RepID=UPI001CC6994B|nr:plasma membrane-associated cation-binding protein 1 [Telopea speciosissima]
MGYWKSKVLPKIKKVFEKNVNKKAATEACKSFDDSKEEINKEFEEKKTELQPKVIEVYEASSTEIKTLVKERTDGGVKKNATTVQTFLEELVKIEFPGSKQVCEASSKLGPVLVSGPILFVLEKVSTLVVTEEEKPAETTREITTTETATETEAETETIITTEETSVKDKEIAIEEEEEENNKEVKVAEAPAAAPAEEIKSTTVKTETTEPTAPASSEPPKPKVEEAEPPKA